MASGAEVVVGRAWRAEVVGGRACGAEVVDTPHKCGERVAY